MNRKKKTGVLILAGVMACCLWTEVQAAVYSDDTAQSYTSRYGSGKQDAEDGEENYTSGPGAVKAADGQEAETVSGPEIHNVTMSENYHEEFQLYEESINGQYFLYSNIANGGLTDEPVFVDIPADLVYTVEKDGVPISYASRQRVSEKGTYVMRFTAVYDKTVPLSEQEEYRAVFRFRIDEKPARTEVPDDIRSGVSGALGSVIGGSGLSGQEGAGAAGQSGSGVSGQEGAGTAGQSESGVSGQDETGAGGQRESGMSGRDEAGTAAQDETGVSDQDETMDDTKAAEAGAQAGMPEAGTEASEPKEKRSQIYQADDGMYEVTLENGFVFRSSVPEAMITTQPVKLQLEAGGDCRIYLGEEEIEAEGTQELKQFGVYRLVAGDYEFGFEISSGYTNQDSYHSPVGTRITEVRFQDAVVETEDSSLLSMTEDGVYTVTLSGDGGERFTVVLERDTEAPEVSIDLQRQQAEITYQAPDIAEITLAKNGKAPETFRGTVITSPGRYTLTVTDRAGNTTVKEFKLRFHLNFYALAAILLLVAGSAAVIVMLVRKKKNLNVR